MNINKKPSEQPLKPKDEDSSMRLDWEAIISSMESDTTNTSIESETTNTSMEIAMTKQNVEPQLIQESITKGPTEKDLQIIAEIRKEDPLADTAVNLEESSFPERSSEPSALDLFGIRTEEVDAELKVDPEGYKSICLCGHGVSRHVYVSSNYKVCMVAKGYCGCQQVIPLVKVKDTRTFLFTTTGYGPKHALIRGIRAYELKGHAVKFVRPPLCMGCGATSGPLHPVALTPSGMASDTPYGRNVIACSDCLRKIT